MVLCMYYNISYKCITCRKEPERMVKVMSSERELFNDLINRYADLQRIKNAPDPMKEVEYQLKIIKAQLEGFGVVTEDLEIK